ncbi:MAG TPA: bifunctional metallophosphatase/5'-nucleotidase [Micromonosporaceae bacterium]|nr:bifunctional metallophosphatase/5'-nucleotidase [Micromonosporaceae bacterium]
MAQPRARWLRIARILAAPVLAATVVAIAPVAPLRPTPAAAAWTPLSPVDVTWDGSEEHRRPDRTRAARLLAFNDFHGNIDPPTGSGGLVNGTPAGGSEYLGTWVKRLRQEALQSTRSVFTVAAGDLVGASPLVSAAFHDEPAIEVLNAIGLDISAVGNHEFDEGVDELLRLQRGGCHPVDGCADGDGFGGATFQYLAANVVTKQTGRPILPPLQIRHVGGVPVAFVGMTLEGTPGIVNPAGIANVEFRDEVETANRYADVLGRLGIRSLVLLIHEGGSQQTTAPAVPDPSSCANFAGPITGIVAGLRPEYGVVVSGHTHRFYTCQLPNSSGAASVVTSAGSAGTLVTDISMTIDRRTRRFTSASARNVIVENGVRAADGSNSWVTTAPGVYQRNPALVDPEVKRIADKYRAAVAPLANRVVGSISANIATAPGPNGESPLGDVIADAQLAYTRAAGAQIALMNPGGIRAPLTYASQTGGEQPGQVTYGEAFTVQPFNNLVVTQTLTGAQLRAVLEQQFPGFAGQSTQRILQVSAGFTYSYTATAPAGQRVSDLALNGVPITDEASYRVTTNDFLANGGDGFTNLAVGTDRATAPGFDVDALIAYLSAGPVGPGAGDRITRLG